MAVSAKIDDTLLSLDTPVCEIWGEIKRSPYSFRTTETDTNPFHKPCLLETNLSSSIGTTSPAS